MSYTASQAAINSGVAVTWNVMTASSSVNLASVADEKSIIVIKNDNTITGNTATITVSPGGLISSVLGTLSVEVAKDETKVIGPLEGARFKTTGSVETIGCAVTASGTVSSVKIAHIKLP